MYPVHYTTLKIEQAERQHEAAQLRLAASATGRRRRWSLAAWLGSSASTDATPAPIAPMPVPGPIPAEPPAVTTNPDDDRVLVGR